MSRRSAAVKRLNRVQNALRVNQARAPQPSPPGKRLLHEGDRSVSPRPPLTASELVSVPSAHSSHVAIVNFKFLHAEADTGGMFYGRVPAV